MCFFKDRKKNELLIESFGLPVPLAASANQNLTDNIWCAKPEECPPSFDPQVESAAAEPKDSEQSLQNEPWHLIFKSLTDNVWCAKPKECPPSFDPLVKSRMTPSKAFRMNQGTYFSLIFKTEAPFVSGIRLQPPCIASVRTSQHGGKTESLWDRNYGRLCLEVSAETSVGEGKGKEQVTTDGCVLAADNGYGTRAGGWGVKDN